MQFVQYATYCIPIGFFVAILKSLGYSEGATALILAGTNVFTILALPVYGYLNDYVITVKKVVLASTAVAFAAIIMIPFCGGNLFAVFLLFALISMSARALPSIMDGYVTKLTLIRSGLTYSTTRAFGSLGYALTAIIIGRVIDRFGFTVIFFIDAALLIVQFIIARGLEDVPLARAGGRRGMAAAGSGAGDIGFFEAIKQLCRIPRFVIYVVSTTISYLGTNGAQSFLVILVLYVGGNNGQYGMAIAIMAFSEVAVLLSYRRALRGFKARNILMVSLAGFLLKAALFSVSGTVGMVLLTCLTQAISYAIFTPSSMEYIQEMVPENLMATAITLSSAVNGSISNMLGVLAAGFLINLYGIVFVFRAAAVLCLLGLAIFAAGVILGRKGKKTRPAHARG